MIERLGELNDKFFQLYGDLHYNDELLTNVQADFMAKCLFEQYVAEYERLKLSSGIDENKELMRLKMESRAYTPRRRFFRKNRALKQLINEVSVEIESYFRDCNKRLDEYIESLREEEEETAEEIPEEEPEAEPEAKPEDQGEQQAAPETQPEQSPDEAAAAADETTPGEAPSKKRGRRKKTEQSDEQIQGQISFI